MNWTISMFDSEWSSISEIVIYGFGRQGKDYIELFEKYFKVLAIIDNGDKSSNDYRDIPIMKFKEYLCQGIKAKIVVTAAGQAYSSITSSLVECGKKEFVDFMNADVFYMLWTWKTTQKLTVGRLAIPVTEKCTLRCEKCFALIPYFKCPDNYGLDMLKENADLLFSVVDYVGCLNLAGGEPFLNPVIGKFINYLENNYSKNIGKIQIISNGTVLLTEETLVEMSKHKNVVVRLSDYLGSIAYGKRFHEVIEQFDKYRIDCRIEKLDEWVDLGFPGDSIKISDTPNGIQEHMRNCNGKCQLYINGRYYYCGRQWSAEKAFGYELEEDDVLVLDVEKETTYRLKEKLLMYHLGNLSKGYCDYCNRCRGFDCGYAIKAAEQIKAKIQ